MGTRARSLAGVAIVGVVVYVGIDLALAVLRPDVSLLHNPESDYGNGAFAWLMDANFLIRCGLSLAIVAALADVAPMTTTMRIGLALVTIWAIGSGIVAFFPDDLAGAGSTVHGRIHGLAAVIQFLAIAIGAVVVSIEQRRSRRLGGSKIVPLVVAVAAIVALVLLVRTGLRPDSLDGFFERVFLGLELLWIVLIAARIRQENSPGTAPAGLPGSAATSRRT